MTEVGKDDWGKRRSQERKDFLAGRGKELAFFAYLEELMDGETNPWRRWCAAKKLLFTFGDFLDAVTLREALVVYHRGEPPLGCGGADAVVLERVQQKSDSVER